MPADLGTWSCRLGAVGSADPSDYVLSRDELRWHDYPDLAPLRPDPPGAAPARVFGLDCEMVITREGPTLARVSLVALADGDDLWPAAPARAGGAPRVLFDAFVRPELPVLDHLTAVSGVRAEDLAGATLDAAAARLRLAELVAPQDILCGHGLANDLRALGVSHARVIDTLLLYPHPDGPPARRGLAELALAYLRRPIQVGGHSSVEDAVAALELAHLQVEGQRGRLVYVPLPERPRSEGSPSLGDLLGRLALASDDVRCVYLRGSRAVGYAGVRGDGSASDWDFVIVTAARCAPQSDVHLSHGDVEAVLYDEATFTRLIEECTIWALECVFAPRSCVLREEIDFRAHFARHRERTPREVLHASLRRSVSYEAGRQWSKARRYLVQRGDGYAGRKRVFIALRFLCYGAEVAATGAIADLGAYNDLWERLRADTSASWAELSRTYGPIFRRLRAEFCRAAPKLPRYGGPRVRFAPGGPRADEERARVPVGERMPPSGRDSPLATVRLLRALDRGDPLEALQRLQHTYQLGVRQHARFPGVVQLRYTPRSSPPDDPVVRECRGLILDAARDWELLAYPFDRFFNLEEGRGEGFDWDSARVFPKLDGSLAILYWYEGAWRVASSRRPDASGLVGARGPEGGAPFEALFWDIWGRLGYALPPEGEARRCFMFELTSRRHPIVIRHEGEALTLIGARDLETLRELDPLVVADERGWSAARPLDLGAWAAGGGPLAERLRAAAQRLDVSLHEGFVACDAAFRRVKIKSPDYVRLTWLFPLCVPREGLSRRRLLQVVLAGEVAEFVAYCPEHRGAIAALQAEFDALVAAIDAVYEALRPLAEQRAFALAARRHPFHGVLFARRERPDLTTVEALRRAPLARLERWLGVVARA